MNTKQKLNDLIESFSESKLKEVFKFAQGMNKSVPLKELVDYFNECNDVTIRPTPSKKTKLASRLKVFTVDEIRRAIYNRSKDEYMIENKYRENWDSLMRSDDKVELWLNKEVADKPTIDLMEYNLNLLKQTQELWTKE